MNRPERLARRLQTRHAVAVGLSSMIGAGIFAALGPAAQVAGPGILLALVIAAAVAACNATSSARLAMRFPESGGAYVWGRERLGHFWGYLAGWAFVVGKTASLAAMAFAVGAYASPEHARLVAVAAVVALTAVNLRGIDKTARVAAVLVAVVLVVLGLVVVAAWFGGSADTDRLTPLDAGGVRGTLQAAGMLFFAFAGYARIATLGEEVVDPERTIPRAIATAFAVTIALYLVVAVAALAAIGAPALADAAAPLAAVVAAGSFDGWEAVVRAGGAVAAAAVLLSLLAGVSRTVLAMARAHDLPRPLAAVHRTRRVPYLAELAVATVVVGVVLFADLRGAVGFSSFTVLGYYAIANASAWTLDGPRRAWARVVAVGGLSGCVLLACTLPGDAVLVGVGVLASGIVAWVIRGSRRSRSRGRGEVGVR